VGRHLDFHPRHPRHPRLIGALLAGWIGESIGLRAALLETTFVTLIALLILVRSPVRHFRDPAAAAQRSVQLAEGAAESS
jgi:hypothetical protein